MSQFCIFSVKVILWVLNFADSHDVRELRDLWSRVRMLLAIESGGKGGIKTDLVTS